MGDCSGVEEYIDALVNGVAKQRGVKGEINYSKNDARTSLTYDLTGDSDSVLQLWSHMIIPDERRNDEYHVDGQINPRTGNGHVYIHRNGRKVGEIICHGIIDKKNLSLRLLPPRKGVKSRFYAPGPTIGSLSSVLNGLPSQDEVEPPTHFKYLN